MRRTRRLEAREDESCCSLAMDDSERLSVRLTAHGKNERCVPAPAAERGVQ